MGPGPWNQELLYHGGVEAAVIFSMVSISDMDSCKLFISSCNLVTARSFPLDVGVGVAAQMSGSMGSEVSRKLTFCAILVTGFPQPARDFLS